MISVFIDGAQGTTGLEIRERLAGRVEFAMISLDEMDRKSPARRAAALNDADIAILCLPDDAARDAVALVRNPRTRIIDASSAHRIAEGWIYGFPELGFAVADAQRVSNPGCYPTGFLALVQPLVRAGLVPSGWPVTVHAVSGYSGGGKAMIADYEGAAAPPAWKSYGLALTHKHVPEMQRHAGLSVPPVFAPSVANCYRGMVVEVPMNLAALPGRPSVSAIHDTLHRAFDGSRIISVHNSLDGPEIPISQAADTDRLELFIFSDPRGDQLRLIAALDNLGKGAAGAAVQSLNILAGLDETTGLRL